MKALATVDADFIFSEYGCSGLSLFQGAETTVGAIDLALREHDGLVVLPACPLRRIVTPGIRMGGYP
jgi:hypothetical protein